MNEAPDPQDCIHGWKAIAAFLGRSPRAVQRWEAELGLPIRRIKTEKGHAVYASRRELTEWMAGLQPALTEAQNEEVASSPQQSSRRWSRRFTLLAGTAVLLLVVGIPAVVLLPDSEPAHVERVEIRGRFLEARDVANELLWRFDLGQEGGRLVERGQSNYRPNPVLTDLDGDGEEEVVLALSFGAHEGDLGNGHQLYCFSSSGELRWTYQPNLIFRFGGRTFDGASRFLAWMPDGHGNVWVSVNHHTWWPSAVVRLDSSGRHEVRYIHAGGIYAMTTWSLGDRMYLAVGGINNEYQRASLTILDTQASPATSPQTAASEYACDDCPVGQPSAFFVFPRTDVHESTGEAYAMVNGVSAVGDLLKVTTNEARHAAVVHIIDRSFAVRESAVNDSFDSVHDELTERGVFNHRGVDCPYRLSVGQVDTWTPVTGWATRSRSPR